MSLENVLINPKIKTLVPLINLSKEGKEILSLLPDDLISFYGKTNGILGESFKILPFYDPQDPKKTWDSIERANNLEATKFLIDSELLKDFIIIGTLTGLHVLMISKKDHSLWVEDSEEFSKLKIDFYSLLDKLIDEEGE
jgi:hypothetical protein